MAAQHLPQNAQQRLRRLLPAPAIPLDALPWRVLLGTLLGVVVLSLVAIIALLARGNPGAGYILALSLAALGLLGGLLLAALFRQVVLHCAGREQPSGPRRRSGPGDAQGQTTLGEEAIC